MSICRSDLILIINIWARTNSEDMMHYHTKGIALRMPFGNAGMVWRRRLLLLLLLPILICLACGGESSDQSDGDSTAVKVDSTSESQASAKKEKAIKVNVAAVRKGDLVIPIFADGAIRTPRSVEVRTKVAGELVRVYVKDGDRVSGGQLLAQIDQREYVLVLEESRYRYYQALSMAASEEDSLVVNDGALLEFREEKRRLEREQRMGSITREELKRQLLELEMLALQRGAFRQEMFDQRTGLGEARVAEERARLNLDHTEIRAPFSGIVDDFAVVAGEIISIGSVVCTIVNNDELEASVNVLEADLGNLVEGRPALVSVPATGDTIYAMVDVISPLLDDQSRTCEVLIRFENTHGRYRPGMFVRTEIAGWIHSDRLMVPKNAVLLRDNRPLVFKVNGDHAQWLYVETGLENDRWMEIRNVFSGGSLAPDERVVISDHLTLAHEAKISIRKTVKMADRWTVNGEGGEQTP